MLATLIEPLDLDDTGYSVVKAKKMKAANCTLK